MHQPHHHGFRLIIEMMSCSDTIEPLLCCKFPEPVVPKFPRGHLDGDPAGGCKGLCFETRDMGGDPGRPALVQDEPLIRVRCFATQPEVDMRDGYIDTRPSKQVQHHHAVHAATHSSKHALSRKHESTGGQE